MTDIDKIAARHVPMDRWQDGVGWCDCSGRWPCDTARVLEALRAVILAEPAPRADALLAVVEAAKEVVTVADRERFGSENRYNAPGHAHLTPPYWDMGEECERCKAWMTLLDALARYDGEGE